MVLFSARPLEHELEFESVDSFYFSRHIFIFGMQLGLHAWEKRNLADVIRALFLSNYKVDLKFLVITILRRSKQCWQRASDQTNMSLLRHELLAACFLEPVCLFVRVGGISASRCANMDSGSNDVAVDRFGKNVAIHSSIAK